MGLQMIKIEVFLLLFGSLVDFIHDFFPNFIHWHRCFHKLSHFMVLLLIK